MEKDEQIERIYCAAIWYKKLKAGVRNPVNIEEGLVIYGHRHYDIIMNLANILGLRSVENGDRSCGEYEQGFYTNKGRFVDRIEGMKVAKKAGQVPINQGFEELYSEDLW